MVLVIEAKVENADTLLILADDKYASGQYAMAEEKAQAALEKARDAHTLAMQLDANTSSPNGTSSSLSTSYPTTTSFEVTGTDDVETLKKDAGQVVLDIVALP